MTLPIRMLSRPRSSRLKRNKMTLHQRMCYRISILRKCTRVINSENKMKRGFNVLKINMVLSRVSNNQNNSLNFLRRTNKGNKTLKKLNKRQGLMQERKRKWKLNSFRTSRNNKKKTLRRWSKSRKLKNKTRWSRSTRLTKSLKTKENSLKWPKTRTILTR